MLQPISIPTLEVDDWKRLERFLIFGAEQGAYSISEHPLTIETAGAARACLRADGRRVVQTCVDIVIAQRAPRINPALFVLAIAASPKYADAKTNAAALKALPQVARTCRHLATFAEFARQQRGWGRGLRTAVGDWYVEKPVRELAAQMLQDRRPAGWSHRDLLRLAHPKSASPVQNSLFRWAVDGELGSLQDEELTQVHAFARAKKAASEAEVVSLIEDHRLTPEMIPSRWKNSPRVWEALLDGMPYAAMLRNLGTLGALGVIAPQSELCSLAVARLADRRRIRAANVHPIALLGAWLAYKQGYSGRGKVHWAPVPDIVHALEAAFYLAFENVQPVGTRVYLSIDAGESCRTAACHGMRLVTAAMGAAVMAMAFARTERRVVLDAFHERIWRINITAQDRLERACQAIKHEPKETDASLPFKNAMRRGLKIDAFILITDSKTWRGEQHPARALAEYRQATGIPAKLAVLALGAKRYSLADPNDAGQFEVAGFDESVPGVLRDFLAG